MSFKESSGSPAQGILVCLMPEKWHINNIHGWPQVVDPRLPKGCILKGFIVLSFVVISTASKIIAQPSNRARDRTLLGNLSLKPSFLDKTRKNKHQKECATHQRISQITVVSGT